MWHDRMSIVSTRGVAVGLVSLQVAGFRIEVISRDSKSCYCFQSGCRSVCIGVSLCVFVSTNQKLVLGTCLLVWTTVQIVASILAGVYVPLDDLELARVVVYTNLAISI